MAELNSVIIGGLLQDVSTDVSGAKFFLDNVTPDGLHTRVKCMTTNKDVISVLERKKEQCKDNNLFARVVGSLKDFSGLYVNVDHINTYIQGVE